MEILSFVLLIVSLIILSTIRSLRNFNDIKNVYNKTNSSLFIRFKNIWIANENTKDEFVVVNGNYYRFRNNTVINFDIWALVDLHKLFWYIMFNRKLKNLK